MSGFGRGVTTEIVRHRVAMLLRDLDRHDEAVGNAHQEALCKAEELFEELGRAKVSLAAAESRVRVLEAALGLEPGEDP